MSCCARRTVENLLGPFLGFYITFGVLISWLHTKNTWERCNIIHNVNKVSKGIFLMWDVKKSQTDVKTPTTTRPSIPPPFHWQEKSLGKMPGGIFPRTMEFFSFCQVIHSEIEFDSCIRDVCVFSNWFNENRNPVFFYTQNLHWFDVYRSTISSKDKSRIF